ncbi:MAG: YjgP/YjgQ family permease [Verrucomicrobiaceae bacterium]|nr:MAG: YjgP/YjgQ family permease [Verrucomicrobiaceae bacterium]
MFRIFDRYLARQVIVATLFSVTVLSMVLVLGQIFKKLLDKLVEGILPPSVILKFVGYTFPGSLSFTVPWGMLTAVLLVFGRLSADNELIALRMSGQSLRRICAPVFALGLLGSGLCFWINTTVAPFAVAEVRKITQQSLNDPQSLLQPDRMIDDLTGFFIFAEDKEGDKLKNLQIIQLQNSSGARPEKFFFAREGTVEAGNVLKTRRIDMNLERNLMILRDWPAEASPKQVKAMNEKQRAEYQAEQKAGREAFPNVTTAITASSPVPVSLEKLFARGARIKVEGMTMTQLRTGLKDRKALAVDGAVPPSHSEMLTEFNRRISFSLACFILSFVGISFGITAQRRETSIGFVLSLAVGISYFALIMLGGIWQNSPGKYPQLWVWLPNVLFGILGLVMFLRLQRR